jgi:hypothetical protein
MKLDSHVGECEEGSAWLGDIALLERERGRGRELVGGILILGLA